MIGQVATLIDIKKLKLEKNSLPSGTCKVQFVPPPAKVGTQSDVLVSEKISWVA